MMEYKATGSSRNQIKKFVYNLKATFNLEKELYFPVVRFIEFVLPRLDERFQLDIIEKSKMPGQYAVAIPSQHTIRIREDVYYDACADKARARFTLCHEVGHYFMHNESTVTLCRLDDGHKLPAYQNPEWQANVFAEYLLMTPEIVAGLSIEEVCDKCKVSKRCAEIQFSSR